MKDNLLFLSLQYIIDEHRQNIKILPKIAIEKMHQQTLRTSLGMGWVFFRDFVYFGVFILFRYLMSGSGQIEEMNFILYLILGMIPWNFMNECINSSIMAIKESRGILSSIKFPIAILPTIDILAVFLKRLFTLIILFIVVIVFGDIRNVTWWMFIYYFLCMFTFMVTWNLVFSALVSISNDFEQLYRAIAGVVFFTMPIIWSFDVIKPYPTIIRIFKLNPFVYIIEGFRDSCVKGNLPDLQYTIYFFCITFVLFCIGSVLQYKLRRHYVDLI